MGKEIEQSALQRNHEIIAIIDNQIQLEQNNDKLFNADVVIDFSIPQYAYSNILRYTELNIPVVVGTTGWYEHLNAFKEFVVKQEKSVFVASNFSIGMNIAFELNRKMASLFADQPQYSLKIEETHHLQKKDAPSGTAITLANDIISENNFKKSWINQPTSNSEQIEIISHRSDNVFGIHSVIYNSEFDQIELKHSAHSRKGFAYGAILASEWLIGKKGFFTMNDMLNL